MASIFISSDHAGINLRNLLASHLQDKGHIVKTFGPNPNETCDYPDSAKEVCEKVLANKDSFGILICRTGIGMSMAANRFHGIRAALCTCEFHARACRNHNDANVLCLGEGITGFALASSIVDIFLASDFEGGRHLRRINKFNNGFELNKDTQN